jgi:ABC-2 type transport system permease protein
VSALVSAELLKLRTTRTAFGFLMAIVLLTLAVNAANFATSDFIDEEDLESALAGTGVAAAFLMILGIVGTTGEYRHGTITSTLLGTPERNRVVVAKILAYLIAGAVLGAAALVVTLAVGIPWLSARDAPLELLGAGDYLELVARGIALAALSGALGVGIGAIVRNQVGAIVGSLVYIFVLESLLTLIPGVDDFITKYGLGGVSNALFGATMTDDQLGQVAGGLLFAAYCAVFIAIGIFAMKDRDVTA